MKRIMLKLDEEMFIKLKEYKLKVEKNLKKSLTWEEFVIGVFGLNK